jgi:predicted DNA-binding transcriptional regulator AlpA
MPPIPKDQLSPYGGCASEDIFADALLDIDAVCAFFGGSRPLNRATIYRGIADGRYPRPVKIGRNSNRWLRSECAAALAAIIAEPRLPRTYRGPRDRLRHRQAGQDHP